jgi:MoaA/NifB/PqqE/SkfB family radical SAM enzyme
MDMAAVERLTQRAAIERVPLYAMLELTWHCNFRCVHCFQEGLRDAHHELSTAEWKQLLDELADLGCVFLVLTGGEALVRADFADIYRHAIDRGFVVTIFTNGSLIDQELLALWAERPPRKVEMSLYGMSAEKHRAVTGHAPAPLRSIERLVELGIRVELKASALRPLVGELSAMARFAASLGLDVRIDAGIFRRLDGNRAPLAYRLSPADVVELEAKQPGFTDALDARFAKVPDLGSRVYRCGAGSNSLGVDPSGRFVACPISPQTALDWRKLGAAAAWQGLGSEAARRHAAEARAPTGMPGAVDNCGACSARGSCSRCPGKSWMETRDVERPVTQYCQISRLKLELWRKSA